MAIGATPTQQLGYAAAATSVSATYASGGAAGLNLIAIVNAKSATAVVTPPISSDGTGWTRVALVARGTGRVHVFAKVTTAVDMTGTAFVFTANETTDLALLMYRRSGVDVTTPVGNIATTANGTAGATYTAPATTTQANGDIAYHIVAGSNTVTIVPVWEAGVTNRVAYSPSSGGVFSIFASVGEELLATAGAVAARSETSPNSATDWAALSLDLRISGGAGTGRPHNSVLPAISTDGTPAVGETVTVSDGTWGGSPTFAYQWCRDGAALSGETASSYTLVSGDVAHEVTCLVTATNATGTGAARTAGLTISAAPVAPVNTVAPAITGTAAVGQTLTGTLGTWDNVPTSYARQWLRDGSATGMTGATASTYVVQTGDAGHTITCEVTATNAAGSTAATSNGIAIPAAPVFSVAPVVTDDGTPATGEVVTCSTGTASGSPTYTYQWYRGISPITGETASSYTLAVTDEGASITCHVTATNGGGSATANSNAIVPEVSAPLSDDSFLTYYSGGTGNTDPDLSIGGARGGTYPGGLNALFDRVPGSVAQAGGTFYRVVYIRNTHTTATAADCVAFIEQQLAHEGLEIAVAVPEEAAGVNVPALASQTTAPTGVTWTTATDPVDGEDFGDLAPAAVRGLYVRLTVAPGTTAVAEDDFILAVEGSAA